MAVIVPLDNPRPAMHLSCAHPDATLCTTIVSTSTDREHRVKNLGPPWPTHSLQRPHHMFGCVGVT